MARRPGCHKRNLLYMEEISILGDKVDDLSHALLAEFKNCYRTLNIAVVSGINNILNDESRKNIKASFIKF